MFENFEYLNLINKKLSDYCKGENTLLQAMRYTLNLPGKRLRPILALEVCMALGGEFKNCLPFSCAIEMVHTYSLIHDDLPGMDDDDMRRGKPTNHKVFGEGVAILAGDALLNLAFEIIAAKETVDLVGEKLAILAARALFKASGKDGMVLGQVIDLESEGKSISQDLLQCMHINKTAKLISAACELGGLAAGTDEENLQKIREYGLCIGLMFQIMDDILDATSDKETLGKNLSDNENGKATYVSVLGLRKSREKVKELTEKAIEAISYLGENSETLKKIAINLSDRVK